MTLQSHRILQARSLRSLRSRRAQCNATDPWLVVAKNVEYILHAPPYVEVAPSFKDFTSCSLLWLRH